ncbi:excinuclease ABC subunit UvrA [Nonomuraea sp. FMUSA5-5]|uniref:UvrABC system protein A n=1 Tax=Nonomuraea composti TaxID=2720023 RepID=A0ABX1B7B1_9ACTN|nr:excinuclease ABC subunit UvrA [Nonomuraea sp. FMUSA5-5]NJP91636.1 excinuclease ABC subunit UvrA [Nonomuraea sp. FMUSA5-5]
MDDSIEITGARVNNLKNVSLRIPKNRLVVFTGVSGSGKSSLVFDTIAAEAQRQLNETYTAFIRNRLPSYDKPDVESIDHLSATIVVDQKPVGGNARSTVGTMTDIMPILRVLFSRYGTPSAGYSFAYSFNDPAGMCPGCDGLGRAVRLDIDALIDDERSLDDGAIRFPLFGVGTWQWQIYARSGTFDPAKPVRDYTPAERDLLLHGSGFTVDVHGKNGTLNKVDYEGVADRFTRLYLRRDTSTLSERTRRAVAGLITEGLCPQCHGARLNQAALATRIGPHTIADHAAMEITDLITVLDGLHNPVADAAARALRRLNDIGLGYLTLDRETSTVSGGEAQRLKTVRHLGSALTGMTYVFDEPSAGLHPSDVGRLNTLLRALRDKGNTVLVVEHDPDVIAIADHVIDLGPGAGTHGGQVVFQGDGAALTRADTPTGRALRHRVPLKTSPRHPTGRLPVSPATLHNLHQVALDLPTGVLTCITGVAGSGKSTLATRILPAQHPAVTIVDQSAPGTSARSSPASYLGILDPIRRLFARATGAPPALFSHNSDGACPRCEGRGLIHTDLAFMDPITTVCEMCDGTRYRPDALTHRLRGHSIADVLALTAEQAAAFFTEPAVTARVHALLDVGLGYLTLGQPTSTLSGGELQRMKLAAELHRTGAIHVLDEPTTGLHLSDVQTLIALLDRLVDGGNTVIVIEHHLDVVKRADWVIDLGPGGGKHGGRVLFQGPPQDLVSAPGSITGAHLKAALG